MGEHIYAIDSGRLYRVARDGSYEDIGDGWDGPVVMTGLGQHHCPGRRSLRNRQRNLMIRLRFNPSRPLSARLVEPVYSGPLTMSLWKIPDLGEKPQSLQVSLDKAVEKEVWITTGLTESGQFSKVVTLKDRQNAIHL
jgi:hypothetical protein